MSFFSGYLAIVLFQPLVHIGWCWLYRTVGTCGRYWLYGAVWSPRPYWLYGVVWTTCRYWLYGAVWSPGPYWLYGTPGSKTQRTWCITNQTRRFIQVKPGQLQIFSVVPLRRVRPPSSSTFGHLLFVHSPCQPLLTYFNVMFYAVLAAGISVSLSLVTKPGGRRVLLAPSFAVISLPLQQVSVLIIFFILWSQGNTFLFSRSLFIVMC